MKYLTPLEIIKQQFKLLSTYKEFLNDVRAQKDFRKFKNLAKQLQ
jgi:hypothetical protein